MEALNGGYQTGESKIIDDRDWLGVLWRIMPILMLIAAFAPSFASNVDSILPENISLPQKFAGELGTYIHYFGGKGLFAVASIIPAILLTFGIWKLSTAMGAPKFMASILCSLVIAASVFGIIPNFQNNFENYLFSSLILLSAAYLANAIRNINSFSLGLAFLFATLASLLRPFCFWPQLAVFIATMSTTRGFGSKPIYGLISALCWGPGLYLARHLSDAYNNYMADENLSLIKALDLGALIRNFGTFLSPYLIRDRLTEFLHTPILAAIIGLGCIFLIFVANFKKLSAKRSTIAFLIFFAISAVCNFGFGNLSNYYSIIIPMVICAICGWFEPLKKHSYNFAH